jgi:hypothetical protein
VVDGTTPRIERHMDAGLAFSVAIAPGLARQLYVGDFHDRKLRRLSFSSGEPI